MTEPRTSAITLGTADVRRLISIAGRWGLLSRLAVEVNAMCDPRWEPLLLRTRDDTYLAVQQLVRMLSAAAPELRTVNLDQAEALAVTPLTFGQSEAEIVAQLGRRAIVGSRLLRPLLTELPEDTNTWGDTRKIVDRLDFDGRELLGYVRRIDPDRVSEILAELQ